MRDTTLTTAVLCLCCTTEALPAQPASYAWEAVSLNVPGRHYSDAKGVSEIGPSGTVGILDQPQAAGAAVWHGGVGVWTPFREPDRVYGPRILGADAHAQGGYDDPNQWAEATLWFGSRESRVNLHPGPEYLSSSVEDVNGPMAVGHVDDRRGVRRAAYWTSDGFTLLTPRPDDINATAFVTDGRWQGGNQYVNAILWKGTPESRVVMNPPGYPGAVIYGMAYADGVGTQVGFGSTRLDSGRIREHALLWHDTPESYVVMHPSFAPEEWSLMRDTTGSIHCGVVDNEAGIWFGDDPDSFHSLHDYVPPEGRGPSDAFEVDVYDGVIYVAGTVTKNIDGQIQTHAYLWIGTPIDGITGQAPAPGEASEPSRPASVPARE